VDNEEWSPFAPPRRFPFTPPLTPLPAETFFAAGTPQPHFNLLVRQPHGCFRQCLTRGLPTSPALPKCLSIVSTISDGLTSKISASLTTALIVGLRTPRSKRLMYVLSNPLSKASASWDSFFSCRISLRASPNAFSGPDSGWMCLLLAFLAALVSRCANQDNADTLWTLILRTIVRVLAPPCQTADRAIRACVR